MAFFRGLAPFRRNSASSVYSPGRTPFFRGQFPDGWRLDFKDDVPRGKPWDQLHEHQPFSYTPWYRAAIIISTSIGMTNIRVKTIQRKSEQETKTPDRNHPAHWPLSVQGNREQTAMMVRAQMAWNAMCKGVSYAGIYRNKRTGRTEIIPFVPGDCWKERQEGELGYVLQLGGSTDKANERFLPASDVFEFSLPQPDGISPLSPWWTARMGLYEGLMGGQVRAARGANGGRPRLALVTPETLKTETVDRIQRDFADRHRGLEESDIPIVLHSGLEAQPIQWGADLNAESNLARLPLRDVSNITGVPQVLLGADDVAAASLEEHVKNLHRFCLKWWFLAYSDEANSKLLTEEEREQETRCCEFDDDMLDGADMRSMIELVRALGGGAPVQTINEIRTSVLKKAPISDPAADKLQIPKNIGQDGSTNNAPKDGSKGAGRPKDSKQAEAIDPKLLAGQSDTAKIWLQREVKACAIRISSEAKAKAKKNPRDYGLFVQKLQTRDAGTHFAKLSDAIRRPLHAIDSALKPDELAQACLSVATNKLDSALSVRQIDFADTVETCTKSLPMLMSRAARDFVKSAGDEGDENAAG